MGSFSAVAVGGNGVAIVFYLKADSWKLARSLDFARDDRCGPSTTLRASANSDARKARLFDLQRLLQLEAESRLGGKHDFLVARKCRTSRTRTRAGNRADGSALAAAGQTPDQRTYARSTADHRG